MRRILPLIALAGLLIQLPDSVAQDARVYRDRVQPQWLSDGVRFWYRNDLPDRGVEFILVDAVHKTRQPAFDHAAVAAQISEHSGRTVDQFHLPFDRLEFSEDDTTVKAIGRQGVWIINRSGNKVRLEEPIHDTHGSTKFFLPVRRSTDKGADTEIELINQLDQAVRLIWISRDGSRQNYGTVDAGTTKTQHTFVGHVWLLQSESGQELAAFEAGRDRAVVLLTTKSLATVSRPRPQPEQQRPTPGAPQVLAPDGRRAAFERDHNLWLADCDADRQLHNEQVVSDDGSAQNSFRRNVSRSRLVDMRYTQADSSIGTPDVRWSPDSRFVVAFQTQPAPERRVYYVESSPSDQLQPKLQSYPYAKPGDPLPHRMPRLFQSDGTEVRLANDLFPNAFRLRFLKWSDDGSRFWLLYNKRGHQTLQVLEVQAQDGTIRTIVDERSDTFIHYSSPGKFELEWLPDDQLLWASERSGWNHLYRYDLNSGQVLNAVTSGQWNVRRIEHIDRIRRVIWFSAVGIQADQDPYHEHFCRINFDGSGMIVLTAGDGTHEIDFSPDRRFLIDRYSRVDRPPVTELLNADDGTQLVHLETADATEVTKVRPLPTRFTAKGRDGKTDIWGIIHWPINFDPQRSYPVVENIYAGPHDHHVPKAFRSRYRHQHQIADRGMIVVQIDGMGTAWRSKSFHDVCYRNLKDAGFPDRIAWIRAAAAKYPAMDTSRVGIYGGSAGGQNAMAALLWHGTFYQAAVADCGCHDNRMDKLWWNEQWMGYPVGAHYAASSNMENAYRLQGQLMLVVGELDRNVDPASTTQVVKKLMDADKDFEFLLVAGAGHGACERPYAARRRAEFLAKHLKANSAAATGF